MENFNKQDNNCDCRDCLGNLGKELSDGMPQVNNSNMLFPNSQIVPPAMDDENVGNGAEKSLSSANMEIFAMDNNEVSLSNQSETSAENETTAEVTQVPLEQSETNAETFPIGNDQENLQNREEGGTPSSNYSRYMLIQSLLATLRNPTRKRALTGNGENSELFTQHHVMATIPPMQSLLPNLRILLRNMQQSRDPSNETNDTNVHITSEQEVVIRKYIRNAIENALTMLEAQNRKKILANRRGTETPSVICVQCKAGASFSWQWVGKENALCTTCVELIDNKILTAKRTIILQETLIELLDVKISSSVPNQPNNNDQPIFCPQTPSNMMSTNLIEENSFNAAELNVPVLESQSTNRPQDIVSNTMTNTTQGIPLAPQAQHSISSNKTSGSIGSHHHGYNPDRHLMTRQTFANLSDSTKQSLLKLPLSTTVSIKYIEWGMPLPPSATATRVNHSQCIEPAEVPKAPGIVNQRPSKRASKYNLHSRVATTSSKKTMHRLPLGKKISTKFSDCRMPLCSPVAVTTINRPPRSDLVDVNNLHSGEATTSFHNGLMNSSKNPACKMPLNKTVRTDYVDLTMPSSSSLTINRSSNIDLVNINNLQVASDGTKPMSSYDLEKPSSSLTAATTTVRPLSTDLVNINNLQVASDGTKPISSYDLEKPSSSLTAATTTVRPLYTDLVNINNLQVASDGTMPISIYDCPGTDLVDLNNLMPFEKPVAMSYEELEMILGSSASGTSNNNPSSIDLVDMSNLQVALTDTMPISCPDFSTAVTGISGPSNVDPVDIHDLELAKTVSKNFDDAAANIAINQQSSAALVDINNQQVSLDETKPIGSADLEIPSCTFAPANRYKYPHLADHNYCLPDPLEED